MSNKIAVLAFSGGLDTSYCVLDLKSHGYDVVTVFVDTGGVDDARVEWIAERAKSLGSVQHHSIDGSQRLWDDVVTPFVMGGALFAGQYPVLCADRTVIAAASAEIAEAIGADAIAHGCTAMGNDQVRFDLALKALSSCPVLAPIRDLQGVAELPREYETSVLRGAGFEVAEDERLYSINENILGVTMSGSEIDTFDAPNDVLARRLTAPRKEWPTEPMDVTFSFKSGELVAVDGAAASGPEMLKHLNQRFGAYGVGRGIYTGDTVIGLKGRIVFEAPGLFSMLEAHRAIEEITLAKSQAASKPPIAAQWTDLVYSGLFHDPLRTDIEAFIRSTQQRVTGDVVVRTDGATCLAVSVDAPHALVGEGAIYAQHADWTAGEAEGFIRMYGQSTALWTDAAEPAST